MKEKEWRKFTVQSALLLVIVLVFSVFRPHGVINGSSTEVMADSSVPATASKKVKKKIKKIKKEKAQAYAVPVKADKEIIETRSSTYIKIPKSVVPSGTAIYLADDYMKSSIRLFIDGVPLKKLEKKYIARYNNGKKYTGNIKKKNKKDILESINTRHFAIKKKKYRIVLELKTKHLYEPVLYETDKSYFISLARPRDIYNKIVVIDAGHGGIDEGTSSAKGDHEKKYTLLVLNELKKLMDKTDVKTYYTRLSDQKVTKAARTNLANNLKADLFISIHCNSVEKDNGKVYGKPYGVETLYSTREPLNSKLSNKKLSKILLDSVAEEVNNKKRGVIRREGLYIMHHSNVPASIIEIGYMSNKSDLKYIVSKSGQKKVAKGIYKGIMKALNIKG